MSSRFQSQKTAIIPHAKFLAHAKYCINRRENERRL